MSKKFFVLFLIIFMASEMLFTNNACAQDNFKKVLIVYDKKTYFGYKNDLTVSISELFGHFKVNVEKKNEKDYKVKEIENYDYVFVIGIEGDFHNENLITDLSNTKKIICWIGKGVETFLDRKTNLSLRHNGTIFDVTQVYYTNKREKEILTPEHMKNFSLKSRREFTVLKSNSEAVKIFSYLSDGANYYPYVLEERNFWYIARVEDDGILFYILADVLYDILGETNFEDSKVFIRIEDVHPFRDINKLKSIAEYLNSKNIPFMIALIPFYKSTESTYITSMSEKKDFVQTIKYMQKLGGSVVLHGVTHAGYGGEITGEGYEFWDGISDAPLNIDMQNYMYEKVGIGLRECVKNDIYPLAFEAPHYAIDSRGYKEIKKYFSTYVGHIQSSDVKFSTTIYPYKLYNTNLVTKLIPENLSYIEIENKFSVEDIFANLEGISIVRGYTGGLFYHPYIDIKDLKEIIEKLEERQVSFYDLKQEDNWVKWDNIEITSKDGEVNARYDESLKKEQPSESKGGYISKINNILMIFIGLFCIIFLVVFYISKRRNNRKFLR